MEVIVDKDGDVYQERVLYHFDLMNIRSSNSNQGEGKSEKRLLHIFPLTKKDARGAGHDAKLDDKFVEIKNFTETSSRIRCEKQGRVNSCDLVHLMRIAAELILLDPKIVWSRDGVKEKLEKFIEDMRASNCDVDAEKLDWILDLLTDSNHKTLAELGHYDIRQKVKNILKSLDASQTFVTPDIIMCVVGYNDFFWVRKGNYDSVFRKVRISAGFVNYALTEPMIQATKEKKYGVKIFE